MPEIILQTSEDRAWVAGLIQAEGCIGSHFAKASNSTTIDISIGMTDPAPVFRFADLSGLSRPIRPRDKKNYKPTWVKNIAGLRGIDCCVTLFPSWKVRNAERLR